VIAELHKIEFYVYTSYSALHGTQPCDFPALSAMDKLVHGCLIGESEIGVR
jgi:hypothetical protein